MTKQGWTTSGRYYDTL